MELRDIIKAGLDRMKEANMKTVDGLTYHELMWRPGPEAGSIGLILFHQARSEDIFIQARIQGKPQVWESERWYQKLNFPVSDIGSHYTAEQVATFHVPELKDLLGYAEAVRARTTDYLKGITAGEFDKIINVPHRGDVTIGWYLTLMMLHLAQHAGEISYLRGIQRGMDK